MPYFPFFANIENMPCLVVGGGQVALRKIEKLLDFFAYNKGGGFGSLR